MSYIRFKTRKYHVYKDEIKFEDWKYFESYLEGKEGYLFKFDLKNGYHHSDIFEARQKFLGFSWVFTPLVKYWRFNSVKITCFLDVRIGIEYSYEEAKRKSEFILKTFMPKIQVLCPKFENLHENHAKFLPG